MTSPANQGKRSISRVQSRFASLAPPPQAQVHYRESVRHVHVGMWSNVDVLSTLPCLRCSWRGSHSLGMKYDRWAEKIQGEAKWWGKITINLRTTSAFINNLLLPQDRCSHPDGTRSGMSTRCQGGTSSLMRRNCRAVPPAGIPGNTAPRRISTKRKR